MLPGGVHLEDGLHLDYALPLASGGGHRAGGLHPGSQRVGLRRHAIRNAHPVKVEIIPQRPVGKDDQPVGVRAGLQRLLTEESIA